MASNTKPFRKNAKHPSPETTSTQLRWDDLALVLALLREGTMSGASRRLGVNVSTVARRLDGIEASLDRHLFDRTVSGIEPTPLARSLLPVAERMEQVHADAMRLVADTESEPEGVVRITAPPGLANWLLAPHLAELRARFPRLQIELLAEIGYADLTRRDADIALRSQRPRGGDLLALRLAERGTFAAAAPALADAVGTVQDLEVLDWITWGSDLAHLPDGQWISQHVPEHRIVLRTSSMDAQLHAARGGLGACMLQAPFLKATGLVPLKLGKRLLREAPLPAPAPLWMVTHRALRQVPRVAAVWSFIAAKAEQWR